MDPRHRGVRTGHRSVLAAAAGAAGAVAVAAAAALAGMPTAAAVASSTTVTPAGHGYTASLDTGSSAAFTVGSVTVTCTSSTTSGQVPAAPGNTNADGPVTLVTSPPTFGPSPCRTNVALTSATTTTNATNGDWTIALQFDPAGSTGTLTIPRAGVVTRISGLASCTITVAPDAAAAVTGRLVDATATTLPRLDLSAGVTVPIRVTGSFGCPTAATAAVFRAVYTLADTTDPVQKFTITA